MIKKTALILMLTVLGSLSIKLDSSLAFTTLERVVEGSVLSSSKNQVLNKDHFENENLIDTLVLEEPVESPEKESEILAFQPLESGKVHEEIMTYAVPSAINPYPFEWRNTLEKEVYVLTNEFRQSNGVKPLEWNEELWLSARSHTEYIYENELFEHTKIYNVGENIYRLSTGNEAKRTAATIVNAWINSPGHRANMLNSSYKYFGAGVLEGSIYYKEYGRRLPTLYATQQFSVVKPQLTSIELIKAPSKRTYFVGDTLNLEGLELTGSYSHGLNKDIALSAVKVTGFNSEIPKDNLKINLSISGFTASFTVDILENGVANVIAGVNRYATAASISQKMYRSADTAILVQANNFPDALAAGPLAYSYKAPILLTNTGSISNTTKKELERLQVKKVILFGGASAISVAVESTLQNEGYQTERIAGSNRYGTAVETAGAIERVIGKRDTTVLVSGVQFADALAAGSYAAKNGFPILLSNGNSIGESTLAYINSSIKKVVVVGGTGVISGDIEAVLKHNGIVVERIAGANRSETSVMMSTAFFKASSRAIVASGYDFADALSAAPYAASENAPILLINGTRIPGSVSELIGNSSFQEVNLIGGEAVICSDVRVGIYNIIKSK